MRARHHAQAATVLARAARLEPRKGSILEALGRAYYNSGQHEHAAETFEALLEVDPSAHYAHYALGQSLKQLGRPKEARTHLRAGRRAEPEQPALPGGARPAGAVPAARRSGLDPPGARPALSSARRGLSSAAVSATDLGDRQRLRIGRRPPSAVAVLHQPRQPEQRDERLRVADLARLRHRDGDAPRDRAETRRRSSSSGPRRSSVGGREVRREVQVHQLRREAGRRPERRRAAATERARMPVSSSSSRGAATAGSSSAPVDLIDDVQRAGRDLQQDAARRVPPLVHEQHVVVSIEREDRDRARMAADVAGCDRAVGASDRVHPEREVPAAVENAALDELFAKIGVRIGRRGVGALRPTRRGRVDFGRVKRRRAGWRVPRRGRFRGRTGRPSRAARAASRSGRAAPAATSPRSPPGRDRSS